MLTKQCPRCRKIIPYGMPSCEACRPAIEEQAEQAKAKRNRYYDDKRRDARSKAFYNSPAWRMLSHTVLQRDEYRCQICHDEIASEVHHVEPIRTAWDRRLDPTNCISICTACHNKQRD